MLSLLSRQLEVRQERPGARRKWSAPFSALLFLLLLLQPCLFSQSHPQSAPSSVYWLGWENILLSNQMHHTKQHSKFVLVIGHRVQTTTENSPSQNNHFNIKFYARNSTIFDRKSKQNSEGQWSELTQTKTSIICFYQQQQKNSHSQILMRKMFILVK